MNDIEKEKNFEYSIELGEGEKLLLSKSEETVFKIVDFQLKNYNKEKEDIAFFEWDEKYFENKDRISNVYLGLDGSKKLLFKNKVILSLEEIYAENISDIQEAFKHVKVEAYNPEDEVFDWLI